MKVETTALLLTLGGYGAWFGVRSATQGAVLTPVVLGTALVISVACSSLFLIWKAG